MVANVRRGDRRDGCLLASGRLIEYARHPVINWLIALVVCVVVASFALARLRARRGSQVDLGKVSESWVTEQRAGKQRDWP